MIVCSPRLVSWLRQGERSPAANTIVEYLTRIPACEPERFGAFPRSVDELRSCMLLLETEPALHFRLAELGKLNPQWALLVEHWEALRQLLRHDDFEAAGAHALLDELLSRAPTCALAL
jgi:hypothetical protein